MENRLSSNDSSFDTPVATGNDDEIMSPSQYLEDKRYDPEVIVASDQADQVNKQELFAALKSLDDEAKIFFKEDIYQMIKQLFMIWRMNMMFLPKE